MTGILLHGWESLEKLYQAMIGILRKTLSSNDKRQQGR